MLFTKVYAQLNEAQKEAVDTLEGPVMVLAGPGTGKTQVLAARIANILQQTDTNPISILALTFTDVAAKNMRERLVELIGSTAYSVKIQTFHAFAQEVIETHADLVELDFSAQALTSLELTEFLRNFLENPKLEFLRTPKSAYHNLKNIISALSNLKREGIFLAQYKKLIFKESKEFELNKTNLSKTKIAEAQKRLGRMTELALAYEAYGKFLEKHNRYDFEDMILKVIAAFKKYPDLLRSYQEEIHYFLVDEYQDTNSAQNQILDLLAEFWGSDANVFVVGDPNQTIYRFQGASMENVLGFLERYPKTKLINLEKGYRCPQQLYLAASEILAQAGENISLSPELFTLLKKPLESQVGAEITGSEIKFLQARTDTTERLQVGKEIQNLLSQKIKPSEIAILFKKNKEAGAIIETLQSLNIPYGFEKEKDILQTELIRQILLCFKIILQIQTAEKIYDLHELLLFDWIRVEKEEIFKLLHEAGKNNQTLFEFLQDLKTTKANYQEILIVLGKLKNLAAADFNLNFLEFVPQVFSDLGLTDFLVEKKDRLGLAILRSFYDEIKIYCQSEQQLKLARFMEIVASLQAQNLPISKKILLGSSEGVKLSTVHSAKGQEWSFVFMTNLADKHWGNARSPYVLPLPKEILRFESETRLDKNADDRRLFYVGITRAKRGLYLSCPQNDELNAKQQLKSQFVVQLEEAGILSTWPELDFKENELELLTNLIPQIAKINFSENFRTWLKELVADFKLSPTALNNYLKNPENFFLNNILCLPSAKTPQLCFGSAIHVSLEYVARHKRHQNKMPSLQQIQTWFEQALQKEVMTTNERESYLNYGKKLLADYFAKNKINFNDTLYLEYKFGKKSQPVVLDSNIYLTGKVDRIDFLDKNKTQVKFVDYKTGTVRSQKDVSGENKAMQQNLSDREKQLPAALRTGLKRQLVFYALLAELDKNFKYTPEIFQLDFVEAVSKNRKGLLEIKISKEEIELLKDLIRQVMGEIRNLEFLNVM